MVVNPHEDFNYKEFLYYAFKTKPCNYLASGSVQPQLTRENLLLYEVPYTNDKEVAKFNDYAYSIRKLIMNNDCENINLKNIREFLLPLLINGQATIS